MQERAHPGAVGLAAPQGAPSVAAPSLPGAKWVYTYITVEIVCQLALLFESLAPARILFRSLAFGTSMALLAVVPGQSRTPHPARTLAVVVMGVLTIAALNPGGSTLLSIVAHWCFYLAIVAPLFWVARLHIRDETLVRLLVILWLFSSVSSLFGVLQAYFPGRFQPSISTMIRPDRVMAIKLASGAWVPRPMGLTDIPGGAASSGLYAVLLGLGVILARPFRYARLAGLLSMVAGMICIYLCQIRAMVIMLGICTAVLFAMFATAGRLSRLAVALAIGSAIALVGFYLAFALGGDSVTSRLATLVESDPTSVYQKNRGHLVEKAFFETLPEFPLGAGLGRWGMINQYFGSPDDGIWTEVQWGGWVLDAGIFMVIIYPLTVLVALASIIRRSLRSMGDEEGVWTAIVVAYGVGTFALTFSYPIFMSTGGIEFWLLTAVALQVTRHRSGALAAAPVGLRPS